MSPRLTESCHGNEKQQAANSTGKIFLLRPSSRLLAVGLSLATSDNGRTGFPDPEYSIYMESAGDRVEVGKVARGKDIRRGNARSQSGLPSIPPAAVRINSPDAESECLIITGSDCPIGS